MIKFDNILKFVSVFLSGDLTLIHESPDYIMEKFEQFLGKDIKIKKHLKTSDLYKEHNKIWKHDDYRLNSIFNFLFDILDYSKKSVVEASYKKGSIYTSAIINILCEPKDYVYLFNYWIGEFSDIYNEDGGGLHLKLKKDMHKVYFESVEDEYSDFFVKLERKEKLKKIKNDTRTL